ncbi:MAG: tripartite tricarboxylate transporter substrate binding protein [Rubrivivax sp.]|nr:tripartite tricarboxylate transporter substrate binding protein [Rubrivivax sp.]
MSRTRRALLGWWPLAGWPLLGSQGARAQGRYPERPVTVVVPFAPGGIADITARAVAEAMGRQLGQPFVVENKPSAGSIVATQAVASARPDGHTLLLMSNAHAVSVGLFRKLPYDVQRDFTPVGTLAAFDLGFFAAATSRLATLAQALAYARDWPGRLTIGTITVGSTQHLAAKLFEAMAGIDALIVPYKGTPAVLTALRSGEIDLAVEILGPMLPQVSAGTIRALAVGSEARHAAMPAVPTVIAAGVPGYSVASWNALAVPAATPAPVVETLHAALERALAAQAVKAEFERLGVRALPGTPGALRQLLAREIDRWGGVIRRAKIEPE